MIPQSEYWNFVHQNFFQNRVSLSSAPPSVQHISSTHKSHSFSASKIPQFKHPSVPHQKPLSFTPKTLRFNTKNPSVPHPSVQHRKPLISTQKIPQFHTKNPSVQHPSKLNWGVLGLELMDFGVELWDFGCWEGVVLVWKRCVELRGTQRKR